MSRVGDPAGPGCPECGISPAPDQEVADLYAKLDKVEEERDGAQRWVEDMANRMKDQSADLYARIENLEAALFLAIDERETALNLLAIYRDGGMSKGAFEDAVKQHLTRCGR